MDRCRVSDQQEQAGQELSQPGDPFRTMPPSKTWSSTDDGRNQLTTGLRAGKADPSVGCRVPGRGTSRRDVEGLMHPGGVVVGRVGDLFAASRREHPRRRRLAHHRAHSRVPARAVHLASGQVPRRHTARAYPAGTRPGRGSRSSRVAGSPRSRAGRSRRSSLGSIRCAGQDLGGHPARAPGLTHATAPVGGQTSRDSTRKASCRSGYAWPTPRSRTGEGPVGWAAESDRRRTKRAPEPHRSAWGEVARAVADQPVGRVPGGEAGLVAR